MGNEKENEFAEAVMMLSASPQNHEIEELIDRTANALILLEGARRARLDAETVFDLAREYREAEGEIFAYINKRIQDSANSVGKATPR